MKTLILRERAILDLIQNKEKEIYNMYDKLVSNEEIPREKIYELEKKLIQIENEISNLVTKVINMRKENTNKHQMKLNMCSIISFASMGLFFYSPLLAVIINSICLSFSIRETKLRKQERESDPVNMEFVNYLKSLNITIENCHTFLNSRINKLDCVEGKTDTKKLNEKYNIANNVIMIYMLFGILPTNISDEFKEIMTKILKSNLNTDENNLETLLKMERNRFQEEEQKKFSFSN